jgi:subtilase family protein
MQQMNALLQEKKSRTPAQAKISSQVLYTARMLQGQPVAPGVAELQTGLELDPQNNLYVDIAANVTDNLLQQLRSVGARVVRSNAAYHTVRAFVPPHVLETIASFPDVIFISPKQQSTTWEPESDWQAHTARRAQPTYAKRAAAMRAKLGPLLTNGTGQGSVTSEGDETHRAFDARGTFGINGAGLKIGVLSDGVSSLAASQALGDLGPVTVLPGQTGSGDEGTAMLEIIHDLAPGASLYFATADPTIDQFAQNIRDLRTAGCDIIVDDVFYFVETPFQDGQTSIGTSANHGGVVIQAVNDVTASGAMYFSSAGNEGNLDDGFSSTYEGDFVSAGTNPLLPGGTVQRFGSTAFDQITFDGGPVFLHWADPLGGSANDYDLFILDPSGTIVLDASTDIQSGTQDPIEAVSLSANTDVAGNLLVVFQNTGAANRFFHVDTAGGGVAVATAGQLHGHAAAASAFAVAATPAFLPFTTGFPSGPFPNPFNATNLVEPFTSDGPRQIFFMADGTPITPGNFTHTGGLIRPKPEITAADGVSVTGVGGFPSTFYGTSAAAPHAGAVAALVKSAKPSLTNAQVSAALTSTAVDIQTAGVDRDSGAGIVLAFEAVQSLGVPGAANPEFGTIVPTENGGNGDGVIEAGESATLAIQLKNTAGVLDATGITTTLTTTTPGITISQANSAYPDLPAGTGIANNTTPFAFDVPFNLPCGMAIDFTLSVTYTGGQSPRLLTFTIPTGPPAVTIMTTLDSIAPTGSMGVTTATGNQTGRVFRDGNPSTCGTPKGFPGIFDPGNSRRYDAYTFTACRNTCANIAVSSTTGATLFSVAYSPSFVPGNTQTNYVGDAGFSSSQVGYGIDTVAGSPYTVVVHEVNPGGGVGSIYTMQIPGCAVTCDFTVPSTLAPITVTQGQSSTPQHFTITPVSSIDVPITFSCSGLPAHATCSFSPNGVTPGNAMADVAITITTKAPASAQAKPRSGPIYALWMPFGGIGLMTIAGVGTRKQSRKTLVVLAVLMIALLATIVSCGGGSNSGPPPPSGTPKGTFNVTVTSNSGSSSHHSALTLTVQ